MNVFRCMLPRGLLVTRTCTRWTPIRAYSTRNGTRINRRSVDLRKVPSRALCDYAGQSDHVITSPWKTHPIPEDITISNLLISRWSLATDKTALIDGKNGTEITYGLLADLVMSIAASLAKHGVGKDTTVSICSPNSVEMALLLVAVPATGATVSPLNPQLTQGEVQKLVEQSGSEYLVTTPQLLHKFENPVSQFKQVFTIGKADGFKSVDELIADGQGLDMPCPEVDPVRDTALIAFSSGTTGLAKGVKLSHYNLVAAILSTNTPAPGCTIRSLGDITVNMFPFAHVGGFAVVLFGSFYSLSTLVLYEMFDFEEFLAANEKYKSNHLVVPPPLCVRILSDPAVERYNLTKIKKVISGAAPISETVQRALCERLKLSSFRQVYGLTEVTGISHSDDERNIKMGSAGLPLPNMMAKIVDPLTGQDLPSTATGEVYIRGPQVMLGYLNQPEDTANIIDKDGWLKTGDIGHHDAEGHLFITDRSKDLIKYKGLQVAPAELEGLLLGHPLVADAAVVGVAEPRAGEVPRAFVVLQQGAKADKTMEQVLKDFIAERVAPFKQLRGGIQFVESIPKLASGKILKRVLREME